MKPFYSKWQALLDEYCILNYEKMKFRFSNTPVVCCKAAIFQKIPAACRKCQWSSNYDTQFWTPNQNNASCRTALFTLFCKQKFITRVLLLKTTPLYPFIFFFLKRILKLMQFTCQLLVYKPLARFCYRVICLRLKTKRPTTFTILGTRNTF